METNLTCPSVVCKSDNTVKDNTLKDNLKGVGTAQRMAYAAYALADALIEYEQKEKVE